MPLLVLLLCGAVSAGLILLPPAPRGAEAPATEFSAARAMVVVESIAQKPHPLGSRENLRVRNWLAKELARLRWEVKFESGLLYGRYNISAAQNLYARLPGTSNGRAVLLTAHYDSVAFGPGAADDAAGVAALLETARALAAGAPLRNDIILCLSDGEEGGLRGAETLLTYAPWAKEVALVVNFEARGVRGPSLMFHSHGGAAVLKSFFRESPRPVASSAMAGLADMLPTRTEFAVYREAGYRGLDFAFIRGVEYYHTALDSPENLDRGSLQHHGSNALALARHFGDSDLGRPAETEELVYFNLFGPWIVFYPMGWAQLLVWAVALLAIAPLLVAIHRRRIEGRQAALAGLLLLIPIPVVILLNAVVPLAGLSRFGPYALYNQTWYVLGYWALTLGSLLPYAAWALRKVGVLALSSVASAALAVLLLAFHRVFPGASYLLQWPLLGLAVAALLVACGRDAGKGSALGWILHACALPSVLIVPPMICLLFDTFTLLVGPVLMVAVWGSLVLMLPALSGTLDRMRRGVWGALLAAGLMASLVAVGDNRFTPARPEMYDLQYSYDHSSGQAWWLTGEKNPTRWLGGFFPAPEPFERGQIIPDDRQSLLRSPAPLPEMAVGSVQVEEVSDLGGLRRYKLRVKPAEATNGFVLYAPHDSGLREVRHAGRTVGSTRELAAWVLRYNGRCDEGLLLELDYDIVGEESAPVLHLTEWAEGFPPGPAAALTDRPPWLIPRTNALPNYDLSWANVRKGDVESMLQFDHYNWNNGSFVHQRFALSRPAP